MCSLSGIPCQGPAKGTHFAFLLTRLSWHLVWPCWHSTHNKFGLSVSVCSPTLKCINIPSLHCYNMGVRAEEAGRFMPSTHQFSLTVSAALARNKVCKIICLCPARNKVCTLICLCLNLQILESGSSYVTSTWTRALVWLLQPTAPMRTPLLLAPLSEQPGGQLQLRSTVCSTRLWLL